MLMPCSGRLRRPSEVCHRLALGVLFAVAAAEAAAQQFRLGQVAKVYEQNCASCHGANLQGARAPSMLDDVWVQGADDDSLARSIRDGFPERGMPGWGTKFTGEEIRALVIFIREQRVKFQNGQLVFPKPKDALLVETQLHAYELNTWVGDLEEPWSLAFLDAERAVVTEKRGQAWRIEGGRRAAEPIAGLPAVEAAGQGGLYDVVPHPQFAANGWLYFAFADPRPEGSLTRVIRGKLRGNVLTAVETVFQAEPGHYIPMRARVHWGGRIAFGPDGFLYFTLGERGQRDHAQELTRPNGKVHRLHDDGRVPADNPFRTRPQAVPSIWSYGHRNPQGLAVHPVSGDIFALEHGPRGGDELNLIRRGANYGWPVITYGMEYSGEPITARTHQEGMAQPVAYWVPSLGVCGMNFYTGELFPRWKHHLFLASLSAEELRRLELGDGGVVAQEIIFKGIGRIRHVITGPDGALYVLLPQRIVRLAPAGPSPGSAGARFSAARP